jgi:predicted ATPase
LSTAVKSKDPVHKVLAREALGFTSFAYGDLPEAHKHLQESIAMCEDEKEAAYHDLSAQDPRVHVRLYDGMILWLLGYPDQAVRMCAEARGYAGRSQHPFTQAMADTISLRINQFRGEAGAVTREAAHAIELCEAHDFVHYLAMALLLRGWARAVQGDFDGGLAEMRKGLDMERRTGARLYEPYSLALLGDACLRHGHVSLAMEYLSQAKDRLDERSGGRFYEAEIYRLLGEATVRSGQDPEQADRLFRKGLEIARRQNAKSLELRLAMSLHDLAAGNGQRSKYQRQLAKIVEWFNEGFDTADLVAARSRLSDTAVAAGK